MPGGVDRRPEDAEHVDLVDALAREARGAELAGVAVVGDRLVAVSRHDEDPRTGGRPHRRGRAAPVRSLHLAARIHGREHDDEERGRRPGAGEAGRPGAGAAEADPGGDQQRNQRADQVSRVHEVEAEPRRARTGRSSAAAATRGDGQAARRSRSGRAAKQQSEGDRAMTSPRSTTASRRWRTRGCPTKPPGSGLARNPRTVSRRRAGRARRSRKCSSCRTPPARSRAGAGPGRRRRSPRGPPSGAASGPAAGEEPQPLRSDEEDGEVVGAERERRGRGPQGQISTRRIVAGSARRSRAPTRRRERAGRMSAPPASTRPGTG